MGTLSDYDMFEVTALVYNRRASEYDLLKQVKAETDDGEEDWALLHQERLKNHTASEAKWKGLLRRCTAQGPKLI